MSALPEKQATPLRNRIVTVVTATLGAQVVASTASAVLPTIAPKVAASLQVSPVLVGYYVTLIYASAMAASLFSGNLVRRWGAGRAAQAALGVIAVGCLVSAIPSLPAMALGALVLGSSYGLITPASSHLLARFGSASSINFIFSIKQTGVPVGGMMAGAIAPAIALALGWQTAFGVVAAAAVVAMVLLEPLHRSWDTDRNPEIGLLQNPFSALVLAQTVPVLRWLMVITTTYVVVQVCLTTFVVTALVTEGGFSLLEAGAVFSVMQLGGVVGRLAWGWIADRFGNGIAVLGIVGGLMAGASLGAAAVTPEWSRLAIYGLFIVYGATAIGWNGVFHAVLARHSPAGQVSTISGAAMFYSSAGILLGVPAFTALHHVLGNYGQLFGLMALVACAGIAGCWLAHKNLPAASY